MATFTALWTAIKNYKKIIYIAIAAIIIVGGSIEEGRICYYKHQVTKLKAEINTANIAQCNTIISEMKDHIIRIGKIDKETAKTTGQINNIKIEGKCIKDEEYYRTASDICSRFNNGLR
jgi:hypothetical protein